MKQCIIFLMVGVFFSIPIQAQKVAMFETTFYFEDALGNMDSIRVGHDTAANSTFNPDFGEEFINAPFDSVFEVRAAHRHSTGLNLENKLSKKIIGSTEGPLYPVDNCIIGGERILFAVHSKYPPVTVTWDSTEFLHSYCRVGSHLSDLFVSETFWEWWLNPEWVKEFACLSDTGTYVIDFNGKWDVPYLVLPFPVEGGNGMDSVHCLLFKPNPYYLYTPCQSWWVGTENPEVHYINLWGPNPVQDVLSRSDQVDADWQVVSLLGEVLLEGHGSTISMGGLPIGNYVVVSLLDNGMDIQKIQKLE